MTMCPADIADRVDPACPVDARLRLMSPDPA
jgi:hypothetical protein